MPVTNVVVGPAGARGAGELALQDREGAHRLRAGQSRKLTFGHAGIGSQTHLAAENFVYAGEDRRDRTCPTRAKAPALTGLVGGETSFVVGQRRRRDRPHPGRAPARARRDQQGRGAAAARRAADRARPCPGFENTGWFGLVAPTGTPKEIVAEGLPRHQEGARGERPARRASTCRAWRRWATRRRRWRATMKEESALWARVVQGAQDRGEVKVDLAQVEEAAKELYIRALKHAAARHQAGLRRARRGARPTPARSACSAP